MKHNIRINGEVKEIEGGLGSGILDKNGREIFEGDIVKIEGHFFTYTVLFINGVFVLGRDLLNKYLSNALVIIGHVDD